MERISLREARDLGLLKYFTGNPCKHGHIDERYVIGRGCVTCSVIKRKRWTGENRERCIEYSNRYREKNPNYSANCIRKYREKHPEWQREYERNRWQKNKNELTEKRKKHQSENKEMWANYSRNRRAAAKRADGSHTLEDIKKIGVDQGWICVYCPADIESNYSVDHIVPLSRGGSNFPSNLQLLCGSCNSKKGSKDPVEFAKQIGLLV